MADPTNPTPPIMSVETIAEILDGLKKITPELGNINNLATSLGNNFDLVGGIMDATTIKIMGATKAFDVFDSSLKNSNIQSFSETFKNFNGNTGDLITKFSQLPGAVGKTGQQLLDFVNKTMDAMDASLKFQQGFLGAAAATGTFSDVIKAAGPSLMNLNANMLTNQLRLLDLAKASGVAPAKMAEAYKEIGSIVPDALNKTIDATDKYGQSINVVQAAVELASGTGRENIEVMQGMKKAFETYGASETQALSFQARISEASEKTKINYEYLNKAMTGVADAFSGITDSGPAATAAINSNAEAVSGLSKMFKDSGMSGKESAEAAGTMMQNLSKMSFASKSFLSSQSGGPGGLQGGFKIEEMLREGKEKEVMQMEMDNLKKHMGGQLVTLKEASEDNSGRAAAQLAKQNALMKSGVFGNLIGGDDNKAERLAEGMKKGLSLKDIKLDDEKTNLQNKMDVGREINKTGETVFTDANVKMENAKIMAGSQALDAFQKHFGATTRTDSGTGAQTTNDYLDAGAKEATAKSATELPTSKPNVDNLRTNVMSGIGDALKNASNSITSGAFDFATQKKGYDEANSMKQALLSERERITQAASKSPMNDTQKAEYNDITKKINALDLMNAQASPMNKASLSATAVRQAQTSAGKAAEAVGFKNQAGLGSQGRNGEAPASKTDVTVTINGVVCENCHKPIRPSTHTDVVTQGVQ